MHLTHHVPSRATRRPGDRQDREPGLTARTRANARRRERLTRCAEKRSARP